MCNNTGIEQNVEGPKGEKMLEPPEGEDATLGASDPRTNNQPPH